MSSPVVFNHIPKCAGSSVGNAIAAALGHPTWVYRIDVSLVGAYDDFDALSPAARAQFVFSPDELPECELLTGHISPGTTMVRFPNARHLTTLRHPAPRVASQWMHGRTLSDFDLRHYGRSGGRAFRIARLSLADYLQHEPIAPNIDNTITRFLAWPHPALKPGSFIAESDDETLFEAAMETLDRMDHVGLVEDPQFLMRLGDHLGVTIPEVRLNSRSYVPPHRRPDFDRELDSRTLELLGYRTRLDERLWLEIAARVLPHEDPAALAAAAWNKTVARHQAAPGKAAQPRRVRRAVEVAYAAGVALRYRERPWW